MKRIFSSIFVLSFLLSLSAQSINREFLYVYHKDNSCDAFMCCDIDSIVLSNYDADSVYHQSVQMQVFHTQDSIYRIAIDDIEEASFVSRDLTFAESITEIEKPIKKFFMESEDLEEMSHHIRDIEVMEGIEKAWVSNGSFYVKLKDSGVIVYLFPPEDNHEATEYTVPNKLEMPILSNTTQNTEREYLQEKRMCIINQQYYDEARTSYAEKYSKLKDEYAEAGIHVDLINGNNAGWKFFTEELTKYNLIFLITHGVPNYIATGEYWVNWINIVDEDFFKQLFNENQICKANIKELRFGKEVSIDYIAINYKFIQNYFRGNFENAILFNTACKSFSNDSLYNAFEEKGVRSYLGYTDINTVGKLAGIDFFKNMLWGKNVKESFDLLSSDYKNEFGWGWDDKLDVIAWDAKLKLQGDGGNLGFHLCPDENHPHLIDLGLPSGLKWSCCNIKKDNDTDSIMPENYGGYFAWGELNEKANYNKDNYRFYSNGVYDVIGKDMPESNGITPTYEISGTIYDVAGPEYCMPTAAQCKELLENCKLRWEQSYGVSGCFIIGPNGNSIFLPAGGFRQDNVFSTSEGYAGHYYIGSQCKSSKQSDAYSMTLYPYGAYWSPDCPRFRGCTIRPVSK